MREFTKSMMSYTWATTMFGVQQMVNMMSPQGQRQNHPATEAFNGATQCTTDQMGDVLRATFRAGDNIQRGMVDAMFGVLSLGAGNRGGQGGGRGGQGGGRGGWSASSGSSSGGPGSGANYPQGGDYGQQSSDLGQQSSDFGQRTADVFRQGVRAVGQTADVVGQAVGGAAAGAWGGRGDDGRQSGQTGWGPVPPRPGSGR